MKLTEKRIILIFLVVFDVAMGASVVFIFTNKRQNLFLQPPVHS